MRMKEENEWNEKEDDDEEKGVNLLPYPCPEKTLIEKRGIEKKGIEKRRGKRKKRKLSIGIQET